MQSAREFHALVRMTRGKALSIGGMDNSGNILTSAEIYSSTTGKWTLTGSMAEARDQFAAVVLTNGKVLVEGGVGTGNVILSSAELYDLTTATWSSAGSLSVARAGHTATLLPGGMVLVTGGCTALTCSPAIAASELYNPTSNSWSTTGSLNTPRYSHTAVLLKTGKVLVVGGAGALTPANCTVPPRASGATLPARLPAAT